MRRFASVNAWIIGKPGQQMIVDTGMPGAETALLWEQAEQAGEVAGVEAVVCTHMHRDHAGQVPRLMQKHDGARLFMTREEHCRLIHQSATKAEKSASNLQAFLVKLGIDARTAAKAQPIDYSALSPFPEAFEPLEDGTVLTYGGTRWRVMLGGGHSARAVCLRAENNSLFIAGDQILAGGGPHISVWAGAPEADPLADYLAFLDRLVGQPETMLVLPGHGAPFLGLSAQAALLRQGHKRRLDRLLAQMEGAMTCLEMVPLTFSERVSHHFSDLVPGMTLSLANHLWHAGRLRRHIDDAGAYRFEKVS